MVSTQDQAAVTTGSPNAYVGDLPRKQRQPLGHFPCAQGRRRLELFGEDHNIRPGWITIGNDLSGSNFNPQVCRRTSLSDHFVALLA